MKQNAHTSLPAVLQIMVQEFKTIFTDRGVVLLIFGAGIIYPLLYSWAYSGETIQDVPVSVIDQDDSQYSRQLIRMLQSTQQIAITAHHTSLNQAKTDFYNNTISGILIIEKGFTKNILSGQQAQISLYSDAGYFMLYKQILTGTKTTALTLGAGVELRRLQAQGQQYKQAYNNRSPIGFQSVTLFNSQGGYGSYAMPAVLVLILQQTLLLAIGMIGGTQHELKQHPLLAHIGITTGGVHFLILGRTLTYFILYSVLSVFNLFLVPRIFHLPHVANFGELYVFIIPFLFASIFLSQSIANFFKHRETSIVALLFTTIPFLFLSGLSWPKEATPDFWLAVAQFIPSTASIQGVLQMNSAHASFALVVKHWYWLWVLAGGYYLLAFFSTQLKIKYWKKQHHPLKTSSQES